MAIISICRGTMSGGRAMAECLAEQLDYPILGMEVAQEAAAELGVPASLLEEKIGEPPGLWDRFSSMRRVYVWALQSALVERAAGGNLVYHGLAGGFLLRDAPCALCLRLIAPMERRIRAVTAETDMGVEMAERYIREIDESRARWVKVMYGEDVADPSLYDMVINLETITVDGACALTRAAVSDPQFELTAELRKRLEEFRLACRVRLALAEDPNLRSLDLDADVEDGVVVVRGHAPVLSSGRMGETMARISRSVPGVRDVRLEVEWYDPYP